jgi:hypothetical protein
LFICEKVNDRSALSVGLLEELVRAIVRDIYSVEPIVLQKPKEHYSLEKSLDLLSFQEWTEKALHHLLYMGTYSIGSFL